MKYGLIGERLGHSFSKIIHERLGDYKYELLELKRDEVATYIQGRDFLGINVTIPYKETVIPYLDYIDEAAREIGAVNTVVNRDGKLYGYNTDFYGMRALIERCGIEIAGKKAVILGTGGTQKTAKAVLTAMGAGEILVTSRRKSEGTITYDELYSEHSDAEIIINTTPVGMYPNAGVSAVDVSKFDKLGGVVDAVYNPLSTELVLSARERGIKAEGGLYMLVAQAVRAAEIFLDKKYPRQIIEKIYRGLCQEKENIVLIGMPSSGKSSVGKRLGELLGRELLDTDTLIRENVGREIPDIFKEEGEEKFRDYESDAIRSASARGGIIIATGGGAILRAQNVRSLKSNGRLYFIDRPLEMLIPTSDRPLSSSREAIEKRYKERYPIYTAVCDEHIDGGGTVDEVAERILEVYKN